MNVTVTVTFAVAVTVTVAVADYGMQEANEALQSQLQSSCLSKLE